jgi:hypothetical protein
VQLATVGPNELLCKDLTCQVPNLIPKASRDSSFQVTIDAFTISLSPKGENID